MAIAPGDAAGPRCSGYGGEVGTRGRPAGRGVLGREGLGWAKGSLTGVVPVATRNSESARDPVRRRSCREMTRQKLATCLRLGCVTCAGQGRLLGRAREWAAVPLWQSAQMGAQPGSESGLWRNFELLLSLGESVFELDLAGGSAAELEMGTEAAP